MNEFINHAMHKIKKNEQEKGRQQKLHEELEFLKDLLVDCSSYSLTKESIENRIKLLEKEKIYE